MRKFLLPLLFILLSFAGFSQPVQVGTGTVTSTQSPWEPYYGYSYVQTIYLSTEINASGNITSIQYYYAGSSLDNSNDITVYMAQVDRSNFSSGTDWEPFSNLTQVFSGTLSGYSVPGWITINLTTPFPYNGFKNLLVAVDENKDDYDGSTRFNATNSTSNRTIYFRSDVTNPDPAVPPAGTLGNFFGNIKISGLTAMCNAVQNVTFSNIDSVSAAASWTMPTAGPAVTGFSWELRSSGGPGSGSSGLISSGSGSATSLAFSGLNSNTTYTLFVRSSCDTTYSGWGSYKFTTGCGTYSSFFENFDNVTTPNLPQCWKKLGSSGTIQTQSSNAYSSPNTLYMYASSGSAIVVLPNLTNLSDGTHRLRFKARGNLSAGANMEVGFLTDPNDPTTFNVIQAFVTNTLTYSDYIFPIPVLSGAKALAIRQNSTPAYSSLIDNVYWEAVPSCDVPTGISKTYISMDSVEFSWNAPAIGSPMSYDIYVSLNSANPTASTTPTKSNINITQEGVGGLTSNTKYYYWVRTYCGGTDYSNWSVKDSFVTSCLQVNVPYFQDFETANTPNLPECTSKENAGSGNNWYVSSNPGYGFTTKVLRYDYSSSPANAWFFLRPLNLNAGVSYRLKFSYGSNSTFYTEKLKVMYGSAATSSAMTNLLIDLPNINNSLKKDTTIDFTVPVSGTYNFGFNVYSDANQYYLFVDNIELTVTPTCGQPTDIHVTDIAQGSAKINWSSPTIGSPVSYEVYYNASGAAPDSTTTPQFTNVATMDVTITGLNSNSKYYYWVRTFCGGTDYSFWSEKDSFNTACDPENVPYTLDFESATPPNFPNCIFSENPGTGNQWKVVNNPGTGFTNKTATYSYDINEPANTWFYTQGLNLTGGVSYRLKFKYGNSSTFFGPEKLEVKYGHSANASSMNDLIVDYSNINTGAASISTTDFMVPVSGVYYIGFHAYSDANKDNLYVDDISVIQSPSCEIPDNIHLTGLSNNSAEISWNAPTVGSPVSYEVYYNSTGIVPDSSTTPQYTNIVTTDQTISPLTSNTKYYYWVRTFCGGTDYGMWSAKDSFRTACDPVNVPYEQNFEAATIPNMPPCTMKENAGTGNDWFTASNPGYGFTTKVLRYSYHFSNAANAWFYTQGINLVAGKSYRLKFDYGTSSTFSVEKLKVGYGSSPTSSSMVYQVIDLPSISNNVRKDTIVEFIPAMSGVYYFGFNAYSDADQYSLYLDNILISEVPSCDVPTMVQVKNVSTSGATLEWQPPIIGSPMSYDIYYSQNDSLPTASTTPSLSNVSGPSQNISSLLPNTKYYIYIRTFCGGSDYSVWTAKDSFNTKCDATNIPYSEDFETAQTPNIPACTSIENAGSGNNWYTSNNPGYGFTTKVLRYDYNSINDANAWFFTTGLNLTGGVSYQLKFDYGNNSSFYNEKLKVMYGTASESSAMVNLIVDLPNITGGTKKDTTVDFVPPVTGVYYLGFNAYSDANEFYLYMDNIQVTVSPTCGIPENIAFSNLSSSSVDVNWQPPTLGSPVKYDVYYSVSSTPPADSTTPTIAGINNLSATLNPLQPSTTYYVWIRTFCGGTDYSAWSNVRVFSTPCVSFNVFPFVESFDSIAMPNCWTQQYESGTANWKTVTANGSGNISPKVGTRMVEFRVSNQSSKTKLITPPLDLTGLTNPELTFWMANENWVGDIDELRIYYKNSASGAWTQIGPEYITEHPTWTLMTLALPNPSSTYYIAFEGKSNFARGMDLDNIMVAEAGTVPVKWISFTGVKTNDGNLLSWSTANEMNNQGFEMERSIDGKDFNKIAFIASKGENGNSSGTLQYNFTDVSPALGSNFYRLKQIDKDGKYNYSTIIELKHHITSVAITRAFPNPAKNTLNLEIISPSPEKVSLVITDVSGKVLMQQQMVLSDGLNQKVLNVQNLSAGTYFIKMICNNNCESAIIKFVKQ